jgi:hypothetical protein
MIVGMRKSHTQMMRFVPDCDMNSWPRRPKLPKFSHQERPQNNQRPLRKKRPPAYLNQNQAHARFGTST